MAKDFFDSTSGVQYKLNKQESVINENLSCWSAKDQFGYKDYFILNNDYEIKFGPYESIKEALECVAGSEKDISEETDKELNKIETLNALYQLVIAEAELIRKYQTAIIDGSKENQKQFSETFSEIVAVENENLKKIQGIINEISGEETSAEKTEIDKTEIVNPNNVEDNVSSELLPVNDVKLDFNDNEFETDEYNAGDDDVAGDLFTLSMGEALSANLIEQSQAQNDNSQNNNGTEISLENLNEELNNSNASVDDIISQELMRRYNPYCD